MSNKKGSHPEIGSLIRLKDEMWQALEDRNYTLGLRKMLRILLDIKAADAPPKLKTSIMLEIKNLNRYNFAKTNNKHIADMSTTYWAWGHDVVQILWSKNYLIDESYGMFYPSQMSKKQAYKSPLLSPLTK